MPGSELVTAWCLHKEGSAVEITSMADPLHRYLCSKCAGMRTERAICPWCGTGVPDDCEKRGEGPVYWTVSQEPHCSMECVIAHHRKWLKETERRDRESLPPGGRSRDWPSPV